MGRKSSQIFCFWTGFCIFTEQQNSDIEKSMESFPVGFEKLGSQKGLHSNQLEKLDTSPQMSVMILQKFSINQFQIV